MASFNTRVDRMTEILNDKSVLVALGDGGAHVDMLCDAGYPTYLLGTWVRERQALTLEEGGAAAHLGSGRGLRHPGPRPTRPRPRRGHRHLRRRPAIGSTNRGERRFDLPGGAKRMVMPSRGVEYTVVNGAVTWAGRQAHRSDRGPGAAVLSGLNHDRGHAVFVRSDRIRRQARPGHGRHQGHGRGHRAAPRCRRCDGGDHRTLAVAGRSGGGVVRPGRHQHTRGRGQGGPGSTGPSRRRGHPRQQCRRLLRAERRRAGSWRRGLAGRHQRQPVRRRPPRPRAAARNAEAGIRRHHPHLVHPAALAAVRGDARLCGRQGGADDLQQGAVEGGRGRRASA